MAKRYWQNPEVAAVPLLFAIQDFSSPQSLIHTRSAFENYVYGYEHDWERDEQGNVKIIPRKLTSHRWGAKEIPSGFFDQPETENVSAILFSNSGTIAKFNRMGFLAGFGSKRVHLTRIGTAVDLDPKAVKPLVFEQSLDDPEYRENWREGIDIWHNPEATRPMAEQFLPHVAHHEQFGRRPHITSSAGAAPVRFVDSPHARRMKPQRSGRKFESRRLRDGLIVLTSVPRSPYLRKLRFL
jgi:hypothetical protein